MSHRQPRPGAAVLLGLALALTGCTGDPATGPSSTAAVETSTRPPSESPSPPPTPSPSPTPAPSPSPTPTPSPVASASTSPSTASTSTAVPDDLSTIADDGEVTVAEAQAVIDVQNQVYNDALLEYLRTRLDSGGVGTAFPEAVVSIMTDELATNEIDLWELAFENQPERINTENPQPVQEEVRRVVGTTDGCVVLRLERATGGLSVDGTPPSIWVMRIVDSRIGSASNETGWYRDALQLEEFQEQREVTCPA